MTLFLNKAIQNHDLDIESHFIKNNSLYLGFKSPFEAGKNTLIIKINHLDAMFAHQSVQAELWQAILLLDPDSGEPMQLSDMTMANDQLFLLSVSRSADKKSVLWRYQPKDNSVIYIQQFPDLKAEGITYQPIKSVFTLVFDEDKKSNSKYLTIPFPN